MLYKVTTFILLVAYPLTGDELKWRTAPTLPMQDLSRKFGTKVGKSSKNKDRFLKKSKEPFTHFEVAV